MLAWYQFQIFQSAMVSQNKNDKYHAKKSWVMHINNVDSFKCFHHFDCCILPSTMYCIGATISVHYYSLCIQTHCAYSCSFCLKLVMSYKHNSINFLI